MKVLACLVLVGLVASSIGKLSYSGYQIIRVFAARPDDLLFLQHEEAPSKLVLWDLGRGNEDWAVDMTFHVHPDLVDDIKAKITARRLVYDVLTTDIQRDIDNESEGNARAQAKPDDEWFESYHTHTEILAWVDEQARACGAGCSTFSIGSSYQGRDLKVIKITGAPNGCVQKPSMWIDSGIHAREWISHTTGMYLLDRLIQENSTDPFVTQIRNTYDWYFLVAVNPDGYDYTWTSDRLWRKTRQPVSGSTCVGTDANRNFDFQWMTVGASDQPCSDTFAGPTAFSEPEAKAVSDFLLSLENVWELFITLHTYGQLWMTPWGYTTDRPADYAEMARVGQAAVDTIRATHGEVYEMGNAASILYLSSGTSRDWAKGVPKIPYVYTIELRSQNSFVLPPSEIRPTGQEIWAALKTTVEKIQEVRPGACISK